MAKIKRYIDEHYYAQVLLRIIGVLFVIGLFLLVCRLHQCKNIPSADGGTTYGKYVVEFMLNNSLFIEILGGLLGIFVAFLLLQARFHITPILALSNTNQLKVQICNDMAYTSLTDIKVELDFIREIRGGKDRRTKRIPINKNEITIIGGRKKGSAGCFYTVHTEPGFVWNDIYDKIRCRVSATNGITGVARVNEYYVEQKDVQYGVFEEAEFVKQDKYYADEGGELWNGEKKTKVLYLQYFVNDLLRATETNDKITNDQMLYRISRAKWQAERLERDQMLSIFPLLKEEEKIIYHLMRRLTMLEQVYKGKKITPLNELKRDYCAKVCNQYLIYLAKQMDEMIKNNN